MKIEYVSCYCGNVMQEHELRDGHWVAIQFCSEKCKENKK